jgi:hypothetical protein
MALPFICPNLRHPPNSPAEEKVMNCGQQAGNTKATAGRNSEEVETRKNLPFDGA